MAQGDPCKAPECEEVQPCSRHTYKGYPRKNKVKDDNVVGLFTGERQEKESDHGVPGGNRDPLMDGRPRRRVQQRIGKRWTQIHDEINSGMYSWNDFVEQLDAEELAKGQLKAHDGTFRGRPPEFIPRAFYLACQREMINRFNYSMQANLEKATESLLELATNPSLMDAKDRAKWLQYIIERVVGKIPDKVVVAAADPWETIIGDILSEADGVALPSYMKTRSSQDG